MKKQSRKAKTQARARSAFLQRAGLAAAALAGLALLAGWWWTAGGGAAVGTLFGATTPTTAGAIGGVTSCFTLPSFLSRIGFSSRASLSTTDDRVKGLLLLEPGADGQVRTYQDDTWDDAGWLGALALDEHGNIYVVPAPRISLLDNPPTDQTTLYRVDTNTGVMAPLLTLPADQPPSQSNPYGLMGLTYDCETHSLYVTSVAGSGRQSELGRIFRLDLSGAQPRIASQLEHVDAIGLGVFRGAHGKRLYFGPARASELRSIALDAQGNFSGLPRVELSLADYDPRGDDKARRVTFDATGGLRLDGLKFNFNLVAGSEHRQNVYRFSYDAALDAWKFLDVTPVTKGGN